MTEPFQKNLQFLKSNLKILSGGLAFLILAFGWLTSTYPLLLENPAWMVNKPADDAIIQTLPSSKAINYTSLKSLLQSKQWQEADQETQTISSGLLSLRKTYTEIDRSLLSAQRINSATTIQKFPCTDLTTLDRLWVHYSNGLFGFSVQKQIVDNDDKLPSPKEIKDQCIRKCNVEVPRSREGGRTIETEKCKWGCDTLRIEAQFKRIPAALGRDPSSVVPRKDPLPSGYYPMPFQDILDSEVNFYREIAKRVALCQIGLGQDPK